MTAAATRASAADGDMASRLAEMERDGRVFGLHALLVSRGGDIDPIAQRRKRPVSATVRLRGRKPNVVVATACDRNGNCGLRRLGRYRP